MKKPEMAVCACGSSINIMPNGCCWVCNESEETEKGRANGPVSPSAMQYQHLAEASRGRAPEPRETKSVADVFTARGSRTPDMEEELFRALDRAQANVRRAHVVASGEARTADEFLQHGIALLRERGKQYDQPSGERSMGKTVAAFNAVTGRDLSEAEGWLLMLILKQVRQWQTTAYHKDSAEDSVSYAALLAEALEAKQDD